MTVLNNLLQQYRHQATDTRNLGDKFERLIANVLVTDLLYANEYSDVWLWNEWQHRSGADVGIDLVAKTKTGDYHAIQCKFYDSNHSLQKADIDSFFTASGKTFATNEGTQTFSNRIIVSTTDKWSKHAEEALDNQQIPVQRLTLTDLENSAIDWQQFSLEHPDKIQLKSKKTLRPHQKTALEKVAAGFKTADRGKLIMACGTGKTYTVLKIAEQLAPEHGIVLFLVPSIALLSQTLPEWTTEADKTLQSFAVCSDSKVGKKSDNEDISTHDLAFPATTDTHKLVNQILGFHGKKQLTVIFSTYQSIAVVAEAQNRGLPEFDLIICDEAHRTTGVTIAGEDDSHFVKVHDQDFIQAKKRLYMTATPRLFSDNAKTEAKENDAALCSMDDVNLYGEELHRLDFSEAVSNGLLSDYKVMVLAVDEKYISLAFQNQITDDNNEINLEDAVKIMGCWNGLSKRMVRDAEGNDLATDNNPMRRAVAFSGSIKQSQKITELFSKVVND